DAVRNALERRMPQKISCEEAARLDPIRFEEPDDVRARESRIFPHCDHESEPGRLRMRRRCGKYQAVVVRRYRVHEVVEVLAPAGNERVELPELRAADRGLHVGDLQVVADMAVDVLVVEAVRETAKLLAKASATGIALAAR